MEKQQNNSQKNVGRRHRRKRRGRISGSVFLLTVCCVALVLVRVFIISGTPSRSNSSGESKEQQAETEEVVTVRETESVSEEISVLLEEASLQAEVYDYDGAAALLRDSEYYGTSEEMQNAAASYTSEQEACVAWDPENVTHIFYHTIIVDPSRAFDGDENEGGYNQYMVTMDEFEKITTTMYEEGYVMVSMHDMCTVNEDGSMSATSILLPEGKTPFVLSQDDVSYYHYMDGDGFADKLILDENGNVKCQYTQEDGTVLIGDYDLVPWIDTFVREHPDFCYHGHKGVIALTGYEGVLGYRTDEVYRTREESRLTEWQNIFFEEHPDFDEAAWQKEVDDATAVANAMKAEGWEFASHTWGHIDPQAVGLDSMMQDTQRWLDNVEPIVGPTDIIIFAFGADIGDWQEYTDDNAFYTYLKGLGFDIFCNVDSSQYWVQFNGESMRMARRNIDGYRMYYNPEMLEDLFTVSDVWDDSRTTPVPEI